MGGTQTGREWHSSKRLGHRHTSSSRLGSTTRRSSVEGQKRRWPLVESRISKNGKLGPGVDGHNSLAPFFFVFKHIAQTRILQLTQCEECRFQDILKLRVSYTLISQQTKYNFPTEDKSLHRATSDLPALDLPNCRVLLSVIRIIVKLRSSSQFKVAQFPAVVKSIFNVFFGSWSPSSQTCR